MIKKFYLMLVCAIVFNLNVFIGLNCLEASVGKVIQIKGQLLMVNMGSNDGLMPGDRITVFDGKKFADGKREKLAILQIQQTFKNSCWAKPISYKNKTLLADAKKMGQSVAVAGLMTEVPYVPLPEVVISKFKGAFDLSALSIGEIFKESSVDTGVSIAVYPFMFFKLFEANYWKIPGMYVAYQQSVTPHKMEISVGEKEQEITKQSYQLGLDARLPYTINNDWLSSTTARLLLLDHKTYESSVKADSSVFFPVSSDSISLFVEEEIQFQKLYNFALSYSRSLKNNTQSSLLPSNISLVKNVLSVSVGMIFMNNYVGSLFGTYENYNLSETTDSSLYKLNELLKNNYNIGLRIGAFY